MTRRRKNTFSGLTQREETIIVLYFGLNHEKALTLEEIGARFSLTRERVRQIKEKAIRRLRFSCGNPLVRRCAIAGHTKEIIEEETLRESMRHTRCPFSDEIDGDIDNHPPGR